MTNQKTTDQISTEMQDEADVYASKYADDAYAASYADAYGYDDADTIADFAYSYAYDAYVYDAKEDAAADAERKE